MENTFLNKVTRANLLNWVLSDKDEKTEFSQGLIAEIICEGYVTITAQEILDRCGYVPGHICEIKTEHEYQPNQIELI